MVVNDRGKRMNKVPHSAARGNLLTCSYVKDIYICLFHFKQLRKTFVVVEVT